MTRYFTWDPVNSNGTSNLDFTNSNRTVTKFGGAGAIYRSGRSLETIPSNEDSDTAVTLTNLVGLPSAGNVIIGFCNATQAFATSTYMGGSGNNSVGLDTSGTRNYGGGTAALTPAMSGTGQVVLLRWRLSSGNAVDWSLDNGATWFSFTLLGGLVGATLYLAYTVYSDGDSWTAAAAAGAPASGGGGSLMGMAG